MTGRCLQRVNGWSRRHHSPSFHYDEWYNDAQGAVNSRSSNERVEDPHRKGFHEHCQTTHLRAEPVNTSCGTGPRLRCLPTTNLEDKFVTINEGWTALFAQRHRNREITYVYIKRLIIMHQLRLYNSMASQGFGALPCSPPLPLPPLPAARPPPRP